MLLTLKLVKETKTAFPTPVVLVVHVLLYLLVVIASNPKIVYFKATVSTTNVITQLDLLADLTALFVSPYILANQERA